MRKLILGLVLTLIGLLVMPSVFGQGRVGVYFVDTAFNKTVKATPGIAGSIGFYAFSNGALDFKFAWKPKALDKKDDYDFSINYLQFFNHGSVRPFLAAGIGYARPIELIRGRGFTFDALYTPLGGGLEIGKGKLCLQGRVGDDITWHRRSRLHRFGYSIAFIFKF